MIRLSDVTVAHGATRVVEGLTAEIEPGRIYWIVGGNGAGKSSLLRVIAGLVPPQGGRVELGLPGPLPPLYFQSEMSLPPSAAVADWERLIERMDDRAGWTGRTELWPMVPRSRRVGRLSTGERERLLLDPLLRQPGAIVLDEPFEHLSPEAKGTLRRLLAERARRHVVVVATNQGVERAREDGGLLLDAGRATPLDSCGARSSTGRWP